MVDECPHGLEIGLVRNAGPFVHEEFLEFERNGATAAGIARMDEAGLLPLALEGDILADIEPPAVDAAIEVELEPRPMGDNVRRHVNYSLAGEWIFLAQSVCFGQLHGACNIRTQPVPVVDGSGDDRPRPALDGPPAIAVRIGDCSH